ncbi:transferase family-domain-containing protein [Immersiella caudata]|uniref:Transferase family-domain-containing protein n=1 Tax=Immersiella caudata TaxID=314043 RepID=A0AA40CCV9_9PEZI|nr:transferase family-domain-containing protein [Immersiella caudata]
MDELIVKPSVSLGEEVIHLSTLDQQAQRHYAKPMFLFRYEHCGLRDPVIKHLRAGLSTALSETPDFASTIVPVPGSTRKELQLELGPGSGAPWRVVDYTDEANQSRWPHGSFDELASNYFSFARIPSEHVVPPSFLDIPDNACKLAALGIQISLIPGGFILAFCWHHTVSDARGANVLLRSWARHTKESFLHGKPNDPTLPSEDKDDRWRLNYGLNNATISEIPEYIIDPSKRCPLTQGSPHLFDRENQIAVPFEISTWYFPAPSIQALRNTLGTAATSDSSPFTPVEAICALLWKHVSRARRLAEKGHQTSLFTTRLEFRARLAPPLDGDFIGNITEPNARMRLPLEEICSPATATSLTTLASAIRQATEAVDEAAVRGYIGLINALSAVTDLTWGYYGFPGPDFGVTDLSGLDVFRTDWGSGLGSPVCMRLAYREEGLLYLFPIDSEGGMEVQVLCEPEAVERLRADEGVTKFATFRG